MPLFLYGCSQTLYKTPPWARWRDDQQAFFQTPEGGNLRMTYEGILYVSSRGALYYVTQRSLLVQCSVARGPLSRPGAPPSPPALRRSGGHGRRRLAARHNLGVLGGGGGCSAALVASTPVTDTAATPPPDTGPRLGAPGSLDVLLPSPAVTGRRHSPPPVGHPSPDSGRREARTGASVATPAAAAAAGRGPPPPHSRRRMPSLPPPRRMAATRPPPRCFEGGSPPPSFLSVLEEGVPHHPVVLVEELGVHEDDRALGRHDR